MKNIIVRTPNCIKILTLVAIKDGGYFTEDEKRDFRKTINTPVCAVLSFKHSHDSGETIAIFKCYLIKGNNIFKRLGNAFRVFKATALGYMDINTVKIIIAA